MTPVGWKFGGEKREERRGGMVLEVCGSSGAAVGGGGRIHCQSGRVERAQSAVQASGFGTLLAEDT